MVLDYVSRPPSRSLTVYGTLRSLRWDLLEASVESWDHNDGTTEVFNFPDDREDNHGSAGSTMNFCDGHAEWVPQAKWTATWSYSQTNGFR